MKKKKTKNPFVVVLLRSIKITGVYIFIYNYNT